MIEDGGISLPETQGLRLWNSLKTRNASCFKLDLTLFVFKHYTHHTYSILCATSPEVRLWHWLRYLVHFSKVYVCWTSCKTDMFTGMQNSLVTDITTVTCAWTSSKQLGDGSSCAMRLKTFLGASLDRTTLGSAWIKCNND